MSAVLENSNESITYNLVLNSNDRIAGTHNNPTFNIEWDSFLPTDITEFKVCYAFQGTTGYYCDGIYQKNPSAPTAGVTNITLATTHATGVTSLTVPTGNLSSIFNGYHVGGVGIPSGTIINSVSGVNPVLLSNPITGSLVSGSVIQVIDRTTVNPVGFTSARILANFGSQSYSYDTNVKGQSLYLGIITRDAQPPTSKFNSYSAFYYQNNPRSIKRPMNNQLTISIMNNSIFQGGVVAYNPDGTSVFFGASASASNYLCDTLNTSPGIKIEGTMLLDMTPWTMVMEFIPINRK